MQTNSYGCDTKTLVSISIIKYNTENALIVCLIISDYIPITIIIQFHLCLLSEIHKIT